MFSIQKIGIPVVRRTAKGKTSDPFTVHAVRAYLYELCLSIAEAGGIVVIATEGKNFIRWNIKETPEGWIEIQL